MWGHLAELADIVITDATDVPKLLRPHVLNQVRACAGGGGGLLPVQLVCQVCNMISPCASKDACPKLPMPEFVIVNLMVPSYAPSYAHTHRSI